MEPERTRMNWSGWLSLQSSIFGVVTFVCILIWALTGGDFWPIWVAMGLALPIALQLSIREAIKAPRRWRPLAIQGAVSGVIVGLNVFIWALTGGTFWPIWPALGLGFFLALHAIILTRVPVRERELTERVEVLTRTRRGALDVQAAELRRIERDLHDGAQARLVSLGMTIGLAEEMVDRDPATARQLLAEAREASSTALVELRHLVRGIHPPVLAERGLDGAVRALALNLRIPTSVDSDLSGRLDTPVESAAYFAIAEALSNVTVHSGATFAYVSIKRTDDRLLMEVGDDGHGGADPSRGTGLRGIERRLAAFDGTMTLSSPPDGPTIVTMELPCALSSPRTTLSSGTD